MRFSIDTEVEQDTRNKSAEFLKNRNNCTSEKGPVDIIREPDQIRCDTGRTKIFAGPKFPWQVSSIAIIM